RNAISSLFGIEMTKNIALEGTDRPHRKPFRANHMMAIRQGSCRSKSKNINAVDDLKGTGGILWSTCRFSDFKIRIVGEGGDNLKEPGQVFKAHKSIVCPQSEYFNVAVGKEGFKV